LELFLTPLQFVFCFVICPSVSCCSFHVFEVTLGNKTLKIKN
jgi:hypothetical protein